MNEEKPTGNGSSEASAAGDLDLICWNEDRMATGVASIDEQHRELIRSLNELHHAYLAGAKREDIQKILRFLGRYVETHFRHEEGLMEQFKCPLRHENRLAHARFLGEYHELVANFSLERDPDQMAAEIINMAARWLSSHICRLDVSLRDRPPEPARDDKKDAGSDPNG